MRDQAVTLVDVRTLFLIANAVEHGGGAVEVTGRLAAGAVRVSVSDEGSGLDAPVDVLIRRGRRGRRGGRGGRGGRRHGHGLRVAHAVAKAHGGRLAAAPSESGARLVLELPATAADASAHRTPA